MLATLDRPRPPHAQRLRRLSARELEVLELMAAGCSNVRIGAVLVLSDRTIESHVRSIYRKLGLSSGEPGVDRRVAAVLAYLASMP